MTGIWLRSLAVIVLTVGACAPINRGGGITVNGTKYPSADAAISAQREASEVGVAGLSRETDPVLGKARIVLPDHDRLRPFVISNNRGPVTPAVVEYLINIDYMSQHFAADALMKVGAFQTAQLVEQNDTVNPDIADADFLVFHQIAPVNNGATWQGHWLVRRAGATETQVASFDIGTKLDSSAWYGSFVKSVREAALRLGAKTAAGAKPTGTLAASGNRTGSGIAVDTIGHFITNNHVVPACQEVHVFDGTDHKAQVIAHDINNDLALLWVEGHTSRPASFRDSGDLRAGESIAVTGYPLSGVVGSDMSITTGILTSLKGPRDDSRIFQISAQVQPGNSGGPALDAGGNVVGVVSSTLNALVFAAATGGGLPQNVNFAIKTNIVGEFLDSNHVKYTRSSEHHDISTPDIADAARKFTVKVDCR